EILIANRGKLGYSAVAQKRFHADGASLAQLAQGARIHVDETAPEREVNDGCAFGRSPLQIERGTVEDRRYRVERHVEDRRRPAGRGRPAAARPALPIRSSGLVEVHVRVDDSG